MISPTVANAFDAVYGLVEHVYTRTGGREHQLIGLDLDESEQNVVGFNAVPIDYERRSSVPEMVDLMLTRWKLVVHAVEAWSSPPGDCAPSEHPERQDVVVITIHSQASIVTAACVVDPEARTIQKGALFEARLEGPAGRKLPMRH